MHVLNNRELLCGPLTADKNIEERSAALSNRIHTRHYSLATPPGAVVVGGVILPASKCTALRASMVLVPLSSVGKSASSSLTTAAIDGRFTSSASVHLANSFFTASGTSGAHTKVFAVPGAR